MAWANRAVAKIGPPVGALARMYIFDAAGNVKTYSNLTFSYNNRGRLSSVTVGSTISNYLYSALGQMIKKTVGSTTTLLVYDEQGHLLGEYPSAGALIQETIWMDNTPVATLPPTPVGYRHLLRTHRPVERTTQDHPAVQQRTRCNDIQLLQRGLRSRSRGNLC